MLVIGFAVTVAAILTWTGRSVLDSAALGGSAAAPLALLVGVTAARRRAPVAPSGCHDWQQLLSFASTPPNPSDSPPTPPLP